MKDSKKMLDLVSKLVLNEAIQQIGINVCSLSEIDVFKHLIVCTNYFFKWSEPKVAIDKSPTTVGNFLYQVICCHVCMEIQINHQGRKIMNEVSDHLPLSRTSKETAFVLGNSTVK